MGINTDKKNGQEIGLVFGAILIGIALYPSISGKTLLEEYVVAGFIFLLLAILTPRLLAPLFTVWMKLAIILSKVITPLVMGVIFFGVLTPVSFFLHLSGKDLLKTNKMNKKNLTFWLDKDKTIPFNMNKQF